MTTPEIVGRPSVPIVYGLCGLAGSGKNTVGDYLRELHTPTGTPVDMLSFASKVKDAAACIFDLDRDMLEGITPEHRAIREQPDEYWSTAFGRPISPRILLQELGTDVGRKWLDPLWVCALERKIVPTHTTIITDVRFRNEMQMIRSHEGIIVWVYRPHDPDQPFDQITSDAAKHVFHNDGLEPCGFSDADHTRHVSETSFLTTAADLIDIVLVNDGTPHRLQQLSRHMDVMLQSFLRHHRATAPIGKPDLPFGEYPLYLRWRLGDFCWSYKTSTDDHDVWFDRNHEFLMHNTRSL